MARFCAKIASGGVYPELADKIAATLETSLIGLELKRFPNGERYARFDESIRGSDLFLIQSMAETNGYSLNDALVETIIIIDAARRASAAEITVVLPFFPYARQDRKALPREPISAAIVIRMLEMIGVSRFVTIDLHSSQLQAVSRLPFDHLTAEPLIVGRLKQVARISKDLLIVSPDAGRAKESEMYANVLGVDYIVIQKIRERKNSQKIARPDFIDGIEGKTCVLVDDMIDTGGTLLSAVELLKKSGAKSVIVFATHGILSNGAAEKFKASSVDKLYLLDTLPQMNAQKIMGNKLEILPVAPLLSDVIKRIATNAPLYEIFMGKNYK